MDQYTRDQLDKIARADPEKAAQYRDLLARATERGDDGKYTRDVATRIDHQADKADRQPSRR